MGAAESSRFRQRRVSWRRLLAWGITLAALAGAAGFVLEWRLLGASTEGAIARTDAEIRARFEAMTSVLAGAASAIARDPAAAAALQSGPDAARALFDVVDTHSRRQVAELDIAVTVYELPGSTAIAWAGRAWDIPGERTRAAPSWFVTPSPAPMLM